MLGVKLVWPHQHTRAEVMVQPNLQQATELHNHHQGGMYTSQDLWVTLHPQQPLP